MRIPVLFDAVEVFKSSKPQAPTTREAPISNLQTAVRNAILELEA
jgi:hypothetical protein